MTDENTRLPSLVEALRECADALSGAGCDPCSVSMNPCDNALYLAEQALAALAAQPRDDVRELLEKAAEALDGTALGNRIDKALSQGDEQPDTDGLAEQVDKLANTIMELEMRGTEDEGACGVAEIRLREYAALRNDRKAVLELLEDCRKGLNVLHSMLTVHDMQGGADTALALRARIDTSLDSISFAGENA